MIDVFEVQIFNKESVRVHDADHAYFSETSQNMLIYSILAASPLAACSPRHIGPTTAALAPSALDSVFTKVLECQ